MSFQSILFATFTAFRAFSVFGGLIFCTVCFAEGLLRLFDRVFSKQEVRI